MTPRTRRDRAGALALLSFLALSPAGCSSEPCGGDGVICTYVGNGRAGLGRDGTGPLEVSLYLPQDLTFGPDGQPYILDWNNHRVRTLDNAGRVRTLIGTGELGDAADGKASETRLNHPTHVAFSATGKLILSAWHNSKVMEMDRASGRIKAICGTGQRAYSGEGGPAAKAVVDLPVATAFDSQGRLYIMDQGNQRIRRVESDKTLRTVVGPPSRYLPKGFVEVCEPAAGPGLAPDCRFCLQAEAKKKDCTGPAARPQGFSGEGVAGTKVFMNQPFSQSAPPSGGFEMGPNDVLYFADTGNHLIRALHPDGKVRTVAGVAPAPYDATELKTKAPRGAFAGDGGAALAARFNRPRDLAVAPDGTIYVADTANSCIRMIDRNRVVSTVAGTCGKRGFAGDGGPPNGALFDRPYGVALDRAGNIYVADTYNHRIRVIFRATTR